MGGTELVWAALEEIWATRLAPVFLKPQELNPDPRRPVPNRETRREGTVVLLGGKGFLKGEQRENHYFGGVH